MNSPVILSIGEISLRTDQPERRTCTRTRWHQQARAWGQAPRNPELKQDRGAPFGRRP